jgi:hypothetical protein
MDYYYMRGGMGTKMRITRGERRLGASDGALVGTYDCMIAVIFKISTCTYDTKDN